MAWSDVGSVVVTIGELLSQEAINLLGVEEEVDRLQTELKWMQSFLFDADAKQGEDERVSCWISDIRNLAYDAEDVVETFVLKVGSKRKGGFSNVMKRYACILKEGRRLHQTRSEIEKIISRANGLTRRLQTYGIKELRVGEGSSSSNERRESRRPYPHIIDDNIVGLDADIKKLVSLLVVEESECGVVSICGMGGLGKTTLAKKVYQHSNVRGHFNHLAWVYVSQQCQKRKVWEEILSGLYIMEKEDRKKTDEALAEKLFNFLKDEKCLVIFDDVWTIEAWESMKAAIFPTRATKTRSKILVTSRNKEIASHSDRRGYTHELQCLKEDESWDLFQKIAYPDKDSAADNSIDGRRKDALGKEMVKHCAGLPLAIIVLGGILATKNSFNGWLIVHENVKSYFKRGKGKEIEQVLALSFDDLPPYLRPCFLYLSHFPEDYEIEAEKLIQLWVAEGIVSAKQEDGNGEEILEDVAEGYLAELEARCMILVRQKDVATSKIKAFQMHDLMRDLCLSKAKQENFIFIVDQSNADSLSAITRVRRVSAHAFFWVQCIKTPNIRSLLFFEEFFPLEVLEKLVPTVYDYVDNHDDEFYNPLYLILLLSLCCKLLSKTGGIWTYVVKNFKLLRVLEFGIGGIAGWKVPSDIGNLINLRFLSLSGLEFIRSKLPSSLGNLRCLQTLDLRFEPQLSGSVYVPDVIWRMEQLRHLYLPKECTSKTKLKLGTLRKLQTLVNFNTKHCYVKDLINLTNLRELKIFGHFNIEDFKEDLSNSPIIASKCLHTLSISCSSDGIDPRHLAHLLSSCVCICKLSLIAKIGKLPEHHYFSEDIAYIYLYQSNLDEDPMPTLEKLPNLRILKFSDSAFKGKKMICSVGGFPRLDSLSLNRLGDLEELQVDEGAMPVLRCLEIVDCRNMKKLPDGLSFITTLQELAIKNMPKAFKDKLVEGGEDFYKVQHVPSITFHKCDDQ